jgi:hypothetical protein
MLIQGRISYMRYEARVTAYDVMDKVCVALVVLVAEDMPQVSSQVVLRRVTTVPGEGESDPSEWARDALVAILESL